MPKNYILRRNFGLQLNWNFFEKKNQKISWFQLVKRSTTFGWKIYVTLYDKIARLRKPNRAILSVR